jgi:Helix-turn-helix domain
MVLFDCQTLSVTCLHGFGSGGGWRAVMAVQAYRFALDPSPGQERALRSHAGAARFAWNWGLAACRERYAAEGKWYSGTELHKRWNTAKTRTAANSFAITALSSGAVPADTDILSPGRRG